MESKFIRPAGAFPQTPAGWKEYQNQFKKEDDDESSKLHIGNYNRGRS